MIEQQQQLNVVAFTIDGGRISAIDVIRNPANCDTSGSHAVSSAS